MSWHLAFKPAIWLSILTKRSTGMSKRTGEQGAVSPGPWTTEAAYLPLLAGLDNLHPLCY
jgi:hypothetical protein